jgi:hypothetical protein
MMLLVQESSIPDICQAALPAYAEAGFVCIKKPASNFFETG